MVLRSEGAESQPSLSAALSPRNGELEPEAGQSLSLKDRKDQGQRRPSLISAPVHTKLNRRKYPSKTTKSLTIFRKFITIPILLSISSTSHFFKIHLKNSVSHLSQPKFLAPIKLISLGIKCTVFSFNTVTAALCSSFHSAFPNHTLMLAFYGAMYLSLL